MDTSLKTLFRPSGLNSSFRSQGNSFAQYICETQAMIRAARKDLNAREMEKIILANSPFEYIPSEAEAYHPRTQKIKNGVLLIHGLFDSPYSMLNLANYFRANNYLVRAILLPGHGTVPGDLLRISYQEWLRAVEFGI